MVSVVLMQPWDHEIRLGLQGSTDELLRCLTEDAGFVMRAQAPMGKLFGHKGSTGEVHVMAGQIAISGEGADQDAAAEAFYAAIGSRPTNEAEFKAS